MDAEPKELKLFTEWERAAVVSARDTMMATKRQAIKDLEEKSETGKPTKTTSQKEVAAPPLKEKRMASASSVSLANAAKKATMMAKADDDDDENNSNTPTGLMSLFGSQAL